MENRSNYSVLMSVYYKEKPEYLRQAMQSMFDQTLPPSDFVLVCDGPLTEGLDAVIAEMQETYSDLLQVIRLQKNGGLGNALNEGLKYCKCEYVARMDSDDISKPERCEKELEVFYNDPTLSIVGCNIEEFEGSVDNIVSVRAVPERCDAIYNFSRKRNPMNHMTVIFKKKNVLDAGGYSEEFHLFEDYYLWIRMFLNGCRAFNVQDRLIRVRVDQNMIARRGGKEYARTMLSFHKWIRQSGWSSLADYVFGALPHAMVCVMPSRVLMIAYSKVRK